MGNIPSIELDAAPGTGRVFRYQDGDKPVPYDPQDDKYLKASIDALTKSSDQKAIIYNSFDLNKVKIYYGPEKMPGFANDVWQGARMVGEEPFYCPLGWFKCAIRFDPKAKDWPLAYHGTTEKRVHNILSDGGFKPGKPKGDNRVYLAEGERGVYFSPCVTYSAAYAMPYKVDGKWVQAVVQVAIRNGVYKKKPGSLPGAFSHQDFTYGSPAHKVTVDSNYPGNENLEWVIRLNKRDKRTVLTSEDDIVIVGVLYKVTDVHPLELPEMKWMKAPLPLEFQKGKTVRYSKLMAQR